MRTALIDLAEELILGVITIGIALAIICLSMLVGVAGTVAADTVIRFFGGGP